GGRRPPRPGESPAPRRQKPNPRMRQPNPRRRNRKRTPSRRKTQGALRACSAVPPRPSPPAPSTIASAPGTKHPRARTNDRQRIVASVVYGAPAIIRLSEPPVAVLVFLTRAAGTGLVAANLAPA